MTELEATYQKLSTEKLLKILENRRDYRPDALDAAENELSLRNLSEDELKASALVLAKEKSELSQRAKVSLSWQEKAGMLLLSCAGVGIIPWASSFFLLRRQGYKQKADQLAMWMGIGYGVFFVGGGLLKWVFKII